MKPLIGITTYGLTEHRVKSQHYQHHYLIPDEYVAAVRRAGGVPVLLPPGEESWGQWIGTVQGVVISGGTDLNPTHYGADPADHRVYPADEARDRTELDFVSAVLAADLPGLFVCRGLQVLNTVCGGSIHPHLPDLERLGGVDIHRNEAGLWTNHQVEVVASSRLAAAMGTTQARPVSGHHQGVDRVGLGLEVVAVAPDGVIEGVEVIAASWAVGVQWHPELTAQEDPSQQGIFDGLVAAALS